MKGCDFMRKGYDLLDGWYSDGNRKKELGQVIDRMYDILIGSKPTALDCEHVIGAIQHMVKNTPIGG